MAFNKSFTDPKTFALGNYWEIDNITYYPLTNMTWFFASCYISLDAKNAGAQPMISINFNNNPGQLSQSDCQAIVLATPDFSDAIAI